jgi:hypothetical protein
MNFMSTITAENILTLIEQLPVSEQSKLRELWNGSPASVEPTNGHASKRPRDLQVAPIATPEEMELAMVSLHWANEHRREYKNQWVALEGNRLIAAGPNHEEVWKASLSDGAKMPFITFVEDPDNIVHIIWV